MEIIQTNTAENYNLVSRAPNFFVLGAAKAGTTSLHYYLNQHPSIYVPAIKEPHFFDSDKYFDGLTFYIENYFKDAGSYHARGDFTPALHKVELAGPRIKNMYGDLPLKFIVLLRDPVQRAWSHYQHAVRNMRESESFEVALQLESERLSRDRWQWVGYYRDGLYADYIQHWFQYYSKDQFLFLLTEDLQTRAVETIAKACEFLDVNPKMKLDLSKRQNAYSEPRSKYLMSFMRGNGSAWLGRLKLNRYISNRMRRRIRNYVFGLNLRSGVRPPKITPELENSLRNKYRSSIEDLQKLIDPDISHWLLNNKDRAR